MAPKGKARKTSKKVAANGEKAVPEKEKAEPEKEKAEPVKEEEVAKASEEEKKDEAKQEDNTIRPTVAPPTVEAEAVVEEDVPKEPEKPSELEGSKGGEGGDEDNPNLTQQGSQPLVGDDERMVKLIEELSDDKECFKTYSELQQELLRRVNADKAFKHDSEENINNYKAKQDSVFDRVEQHKLNGEKKLDMFAEQFEKVHGKDHKTFTEEWLFEQTGRKIELDKVLENPTFQDFCGTYKIWPMSSYIVSKLTIDESDFMGVYDLGAGTSAAKTTPTYEKVSVEKKDDHHHFTETELTELKTAEAAGTKEEKVEDNLHYEESDDEKSTCCASDKSVKPHALGAGEYVQFRLRKENVMQYLNNTSTANKLKSLVEADAPDNPKEPIYIFTASSNGIMRFHPWGGIARKLWHGYGDSTSTGDFIQNIKHAGEYGCFCFGVIYKEKENYKDAATGHHRKGGRTIVMRYNRWATDNAPIYAMVRKSHNDHSVPEQPPHQSFFSCCTSREKDHPVTK